MMCHLSIWKKKKKIYYFRSGVTSHYAIEQSMISIFDMKKTLWGEAKQNPRDFT